MKEETPWLSSPLALLTCLRIPSTRTIFVLYIRIIFLPMFHVRCVTEEVVAVIRPLVMKITAGVPVGRLASGRGMAVTSWMKRSCGSGVSCRYGTLVIYTPCEVLYVILWMRYRGGGCSMAVPVPECKVFSRYFLKCPRGFCIMVIPEGGIRRGVISKPPCCSVLRCYMVHSFGWSGCTQE